MKLKSLYLAILSTSIVTGCSFNNVFNSIPDEHICFSDEGVVIDCQNMQDNIAVDPSAFSNPISVNRAPDPSLFKSKVNFVLLTEYIEQMAMDLEKTLAGNIYGGVAVASFVELDSTLKRTNLLGNQVSEFFITELRKVGLPVSDYKATGYIQVTPSGDFAMSRKVYELKNNLNVNYVLTGTLVENERGTVVNARIVSLSSNRVVATASRLIPSLVTQ